MNFLLITADDMNYNSPGMMGCGVDDVTPNIDRLADEGLRFEQAHVTVSVCQPSRQCMMTGRYPHNSGAPGFDPISLEVPTLQERLREAGYVNGILSKVDHLAPLEKFCWDFVVRKTELRQGRYPELYYQRAKEFFETVRREGRPFFLMANSNDPHRPFAGSDQEKAAGAAGGVKFPPASRYYRPEEVEVPGFLPDIPEVRLEVAEYFTSVRRCDETVGQVLRALGESGFEDDTLVMFLSDNGMAFPFAKTNCYLTSTKTPWIVRFPGKVAPGRVDAEHFISGIDYAPTILEAANLPPLDGMDGRSFLPLLTAGRQEGRERVFTIFNTTYAKGAYPMRCIQDRRYGYIFNAWSDGQTAFRNESQSGRSFKAMEAAAASDPAIDRRVRMFLYRVREELYDFAADPDALSNLIDDPAHIETVRRMREALLEAMCSSSDPLADTFRAHLAGDLV